MIGGLSIFELLGFFAIIVLYFMPIIIASSRKHKNLKMITLLNILIGWTGLGWLACLVWSFIK